MEPIKARLLKHLLTTSPIHFVRYFFQLRGGGKFQVSAHHILMAKTLQRVVDGEITRLIINIPPGYTKTELAVINFVAMGLARNPAARFLHLSYSDTLAKLNSSAAKSIVESDQFQQLWNVKLKTDTQSKNMWYTTDGGGLYATAAGGQVTGFRAGMMVAGFSGALIVDDPMKPDDAKSTVALDTINSRFSNTVSTRLALDRTPIIIIMQRLHSFDLSGFLLQGGSGEKWHHLMLRGLTDKTEHYPRAFTHGLEIKHDLPDGPLWPAKHSAEALERIKMATPYTFDGQFQQDPQNIGQTIFNAEWWKMYNPDVPPMLEWLAIYGDTAQKTGERHDYSVFQLWGYFDGRIYLIDQLRGKWEAHKLKESLTNFVIKHYKPNLTTSRLRYVKVEDKSSGTGLIQECSNTLPIPILPIPRSNDKFTRAMDAAPFIQAGRVFLPEGSPFLHDFITEHSSFRADDSHMHDDQVDSCMDAIQDMLQSVVQAGVFKWD